MSQSPHIDNDIRFNVILRALDSSNTIHEQLNNVNQWASEIGDKHLSNLIGHSNEINLSLKDHSYRGSGYQELLSQCLELDTIVSISPRLDECVDDPKKFNEAINLLEYIEQLHRKYANQIPIIESIYKRSEKHREYTISNLCDRLERLKDSSRDEVLSIVNYLAKCGNFSDRDLRLKYLQARDNWFNNTCEERSSFDHVASVYCTGLPMIFDEYKSIFSDSSEIFTRDCIKFSSTDPTKEDGAIINSWLLFKTSIFIASLQVYLDTSIKSESQTPTMIGDTMKKCFDLTNWLASIGFDFSSQLNPLFVKAITDEVKASIDKATLMFESSFTAAVSESIESLLLPVDDEILRISNMKPEEKIPKSIEHYPIFRIYCLYLVDSLRWITTTKSTLSPVSLCLDVYAALNASLTRVTKALALILNMDNNSNHPILSKIAISLITEVLPFIANYCDMLFPEKVILQAIGLSKSEFKSIYQSDSDKLKNFRMDFRLIADPLKSTMPALVQIIEN